jgi:serine/threonine-protein kinase RsbW
VVVRRAPVVDSAGTLVRVETRIPSDITAIEEAVELIVRHCLSGTVVTQRLRFNLCVALSESLANAIICGNQEDPVKWVDVRAELRPETIVVQVTDEGEGFDPATVRDPTTPEDLEEPCGRGLFLIRSLVDEVRFNPKGNSICLMLRRK